MYTLYLAQLLIHSPDPTYLHQLELKVRPVVLGEAQEGVLLPWLRLCVMREFASMNCYFPAESPRGPLVRIPAAPYASRHRSVVLWAFCQLTDAYPVTA